jgi:AcrR family transcriptional regulator
MWELSRQVRVYGGRHGVPAAVVSRVQRERLLEAMVVVCAEVGYHEASVERVIAQAGVSRRTFYDLFEDRESCFIAAYDEIMTHVITLIVEAFAKPDSLEPRMKRALDAFFEFCIEEPEAARICVVEVLAAGSRARARRDQAIARLTELVEESLRDELDEELSPLAARALIGGVHELIYLRIDRGEMAMLPALAREIVDAQMVPLGRV